MMRYRVATAALIATLIGVAASLVWMVAWSYLLNFWFVRLFYGIGPVAEAHFGISWKTTGNALSFAIDFLVPALLFVPLGALAGLAVHENRATVAGRVICANRATIVLSFIVGALARPLLTLVWYEPLNLALYDFVRFYYWVGPMFTPIGFVLVAVRRTPKHAP